MYRTALERPLFFKRKSQPIEIEPAMGGPETVASPETKRAAPPHTAAAVPAAVDHLGVPGDVNVPAAGHRSMPAADRGVLIPVARDRTPRAADVKVAAGAGCQGAPGNTAAHAAPAPGGVAAMRAGERQVAGDAGPAAAAAGLTEEARARGARLSKRLIGTFGEIVSVVMRSKEWRERPIRDLEALVLPPLLAGQFSLAEAQSKNNGLVAPVAVVLWARVSAEVDARLSASPEAPLRLMPAEWTGGDNIWVVEAIGEPKVLREMLKRLAAKEWAGRMVKMRAWDGDGRAAASTPLGTAARSEQIAVLRQIRSVPINRRLAE